MFIKCNKKVVNTVIITTLVLLVPFSILCIKLYQQGNFNKNTSLFNPLLKQPMDTMVANSVVPIHYWKTKNGAEIYFVPTQQVSVIDLQITFAAGSARDNGKFGLANLVSQAIIDGTNKKKSYQVAAQLDNIGALYVAEIDQDRATFNLRLLNTNKNLAEAVNLLAEIISKPAFHKANIDRLKNRIIVTINKEADDPSRVAQLQFYKLLYNEHPYAGPYLGDLNSLNSITIDDLVHFHNHYYVAKNCTVTIVGGIHRNQAKELSNVLTAALNTGNKAASLPNVNPIPGEMIKTIPFTNSKQSLVIVGQPVAMADDPDYFNLIVGNFILEHRMHSRLINNSSAKEPALAYTVKNDLVTLSKPGAFYVRFNTKPELMEQAIDKVKLSINEFINNGPTDEEVKFAKQRLSVALPMQFITNAGILKQVAYLDFYGLPFDFFDDYANQLSFITRESVFKTWQRRINSDLMAWVIVK